MVRRAACLLILGIHSCGVGMDGNSLEPGYDMNVDGRVELDDSLSSPWSSYGNAQTLTCIQ
ncbi:MAG: hypothetical protein VB099_00850 [Candidatus Limiplasma sp.]|nr:hypothetical protein [Candidatus Limiplasma sp.]